MEEHHQIEVSLLTYILVIVIGLSLIIGYLVKHLNRRNVEKDVHTVTTYDNKLDTYINKEKTLEESMELFN